MQQTSRRERIDRRALRHFTQVRVLVGAVRHAQQPGAVGIGGHLIRVEANLKKAGAQFKAGLFAGHGVNAPA